MDSCRKSIERCVYGQKGRMKRSKQITEQKKQGNEPHLAGSLIFVADCEERDKHSQS